MLCCHRRYSTRPQRRRLRMRHHTRCRLPRLRRRHPRQESRRLQYRRPRTRQHHLSRGRRDRRRAPTALVASRLAVAQVNRSARADQQLSTVRSRSDTGGRWTSEFTDLILYDATLASVGFRKGGEFPEVRSLPHQFDTYCRLPGGLLGVESAGGTFGTACRNESDRCPLPVVEADPRASPK